MYCLLLDRDGVWGSNRENGDSLVRKVPLIVALSVLLLMVCSCYWR